MNIKRRPSRTQEKGEGGDSLGATLGRNEKYQEKDHNREEDHHEHNKERGEV